MTRWLGEGPVLSYRGDGPVLTGGALVCVSLVVCGKRGTFYVDKRHDSAFVTRITGGESFSSFVRCCDAFDFSVLQLFLCWSKISAMDPIKHSCVFKWSSLKFLNSKHYK